MGRLANKVAIVTGAGQGIGRGIARRFAREGAKVLVAEWNAETGRRAAGELAGLGGEGRFLQTDVGDQGQVQAAVQAALDAWGRIDVLVNNAWSGTGMGRVEWKATEEMERAFRVGFLSNFWSMQAVFPHMKRQGGGRVINLCSLNGVNAHMYTV
jgi:NAD(P)-dependent dehydrogenase (short-subunit alcohol dehydrogenase family)